METIEIEGKTLLLAFPDEQKIPWIGDKSYISQIQSAWSSEHDTPFNPRIVGRVGMGRTTLAYSAGKIFKPNSPSEIFVIHCSEKLTPEQILIYEVKKGDQSEYHASPLVSAMVKGSICVVDECQYLSSETWASMSSLLDQRYITSDVVGLKIHAHKNFRVVFTQNYEGKSKNKQKIPTYISTLLKPVININHPSRKHEMDVLQYFFPSLIPPKLVNHLVDFLQSSHFEDRPYSIRDCINILQCYTTLTPKGEDQEIDWNKLYKSVRQILDNQAIYFLNEQLNLSKDSESMFKQDEDIMDDIDNNYNHKITDFYENEEEFAEFIKDEEETEDFEDIDDGFLYLEEEPEGDVENEQNKSRSNITNAKYLKDLRKRIRSKLKKKNDEDKKKNL